MFKISCKNCDTKNGFIEFQELKDLPEFTNRLLVIGECRKCGEVIATLIETRKEDLKEFVDSFCGEEATKVIKREKKRTKFKKTSGHNFHGFVYGVNVEIKNKKGQVKQIRQYASDYLTGKNKLVKTINLNS